MPTGIIAELSREKNNFYKIIQPVYFLENLEQNIFQMGKAKKRILHKTNSSLYMTREGALSEVFSMIKKPQKQARVQALDLITLFGLSAEELSEAGVPYENLKALESLIE